MSATSQQIADMPFLDDRQKTLLKQSVLTMSELADLFKVERNTAKRIAAREGLEVGVNSANARSRVVTINERLLDALRRSRPTNYRGRKGAPAQHYKRGNLAG